jgi:beta-lactamase class C
LLIALTVAGCSGSATGGSTPGRPSGSGSGSGSSNTALTVTVPGRASTSSARRALFVGAATNGATVVATDHVSGSPVLSTTIDLSATSSACVPNSSDGSRACTFALGLAPTAANDSYDITVTTYDTAPSGGTIPSSAKKLATGVVTGKKIVSGKANTISIVLDGVPASVVTNVPTIVFLGSASTQTRTFVFSALDAAGETIVGTFTSPVTLSESDAHLSIALAGGTYGSSVTLGSSTDGAGVQAKYDGAGGATYATTIAVTGVPSPSSVPVTLFRVTGAAPYDTATQTVSFAAAGESESLTLGEIGFTGTFTESDTCGGIATIAIGATSGGTATATVTAGAAGTCEVTFGDGFFAYAAIALDDAGSTTDPVLSTIASDVAKNVRILNIPGAAVDVYYHGKTYTYYYGVQDRTTKVPVSSTTGFELGSVTKSFTALELALAVDYPSLIKSVNPATTVSSVSLADPAASYVTLYPAASTQADTEVGTACPARAAPTPVPSSGYSSTWTSVTLQDLGDHTSTLPDQPPNIFGSGSLPVFERPCYGAQDLENFAETFTPTSGTVGTTYTYSDIGFGLLGDALQGIYDADYYTLTKSLVLSPLGMTHTFDVNTADAGLGSAYATPYESDGTTPTYQWPYNAWPGGGTLRSTAPDMVNYLLAALQISSNAELNGAMKTAQTPIPGITGIASQDLAFQQITLKTTSGGTPFTVTEKDGATGGMTAWIGVVNPGSTSSVGIVVMANEAGSGDVPGALGPAPNLAEAILEDLGP